MGFSHSASAATVAACFYLRDREPQWLELSPGYGADAATAMIVLCAVFDAEIVCVEDAEGDVWRIQREAVTGFCTRAIR